LKSRRLVVEGTTTENAAASITTWRVVRDSDTDSPNSGKFADFARTILAVPKSEADAEEATRPKRISRKR